MFPSSLNLLSISPSLSLICDWNMRHFSFEVYLLQVYLQVYLHVSWKSSVCLRDMLWGSRITVNRRIDYLGGNKIKEKDISHCGVIWTNFINMHWYNGAKTSHVGFCGARAWSNNCLLTYYSINSFKKNTCLFFSFFPFWNTKLLNLDVLKVKTVH